MRLGKVNFWGTSFFFSVNFQAYTRVSHRQSPLCSVQKKQSQNPPGGCIQCGIDATWGINPHQIVWTNFGPRCRLQGWNCEKKIEILNSFSGCLCESLRKSLEDLNLLLQWTSTEYLWFSESDRALITAITCDVSSFMSPGILLGNMLFC